MRVREGYIGYKIRGEFKNVVHLRFIISVKKYIGGLNVAVYDSVFATLVKIM